MMDCLEFSPFFPLIIVVFLPTRSLGTIFWRLIEKWYSTCTHVSKWRLCYIWLLEFGVYQTSLIVPNLNISHNKHIFFKQWYLIILSVVYFLHLSRSYSVKRLSAVLSKYTTQFLIYFIQQLWVNLSRGKNALGVPTNKPWLDETRNI